MWPTIIFFLALTFSYLSIRMFIAEILTVDISLLETLKWSTTLFAIAAILLWSMFYYLTIIK